MAKCVLCKFTKQDPRYGEFITKRDISVHEFCLYLSSGLVQNGQENNGLYGFLPKDIQAEATRGKRLFCCYCRKPYASIGCCETKCRRSFHMICGIDNGCENQFTDTFKSYCDKHIHKFWKKRPPPNEKCCICFDSLIEPGKKNHFVDFIRSPCCQNGWFHKFCLQTFARTSGYFCKCPLCNDTNKFCKEILNRGIFVPERDAAWELEPNAYAELLERPNKCEAEICKHKKGRNANNDESNPLLYCIICGAMASHLLCLPNGSSNYTCKECLQIGESRNDVGDSGRESFQEVDDKKADDDDEEIDVCNISDTEDEIDILEKPFLRRKLQVVSNEKTENCSKGKLNDSLDESSSDDDDFWRIGFKRKINNSAQIINTEDETSSDIKINKNKILTESSDEANGTGSFLECISTKRRKILEPNSSQCNSQDKENSRDKFCKQEDLRNKFNNLNSLTTNRSESSSSSTDPHPRELHSNLFSHEENKTKNDALNISCVANRTRRRKSIYYSDLLENLSESETIESDEKNMNAASSSKILIPSYQLFSGVLTSNSIKRSSSIQYNNQKTRITGQNFDQNENTTDSMPSSIASLQKSSSSGSILSVKSTTSVSTTSSDSNSDNNNLNVSCIAYRTRRRKPIYYSNNYLGPLKEQESQSSSSSSLSSFQKENKRKHIERCSNSLSSTDNSSQLFRFKHTRVARLISTTTEEDDEDAMKNR